jgi:hypothetical protein
MASFGKILHRGRLVEEKTITKYEQIGNIAQ